MSVNKASGLLSDVYTIFVKFSRHNTHMTLAKNWTHVCFSLSTGDLGFDGAKKRTRYAAETTAERCASKAQSLGVQTAEVYLKGEGINKQGVVRQLRRSGIVITRLVERTPIPFNGCRKKKSLRK